MQNEVTAQQFATAVDKQWALNGVATYIRGAVNTPILGTDDVSKYNVPSMEINGPVVVSDKNANYNPQAVGILNQPFTYSSSYRVAEKLNSIAQLEAGIKDPKGSMVQSVANKYVTISDAMILGVATKAAPGNFLGTSYTTGTVAVNTSGAVTGSGTTFTAAMVGLPFKAAGQSKWFRVASFTSATAIQLDNGYDDNPVQNTYSETAVTAGAAYEIQGVTALTTSTGDTLMAEILKARSAVKKFGQENVLAVLPRSWEYLITTSNFAKFSGVTDSYRDLIERGGVRVSGGVDILYSDDENFVGSASTGYRIPVFATPFVTFDYKFPPHAAPYFGSNMPVSDGIVYLETRVLGVKVGDARKKFGACIYAKIA